MFDTIDKVIYKSNLDYGMGILIHLKNCTQILVDMSTDQSKGIKILLRIFNSNLIMIRNAFDLDWNGFDTEIQNLSVISINKEDW